jgi:hypothetical protein
MLQRHPLLLLWISVWSGWFHQGSFVASAMLVCHSTSVAVDLCLVRISLPVAAESPHSISCKFQMTRVLDFFWSWSQLLTEY